MGRFPDEDYISQTDMMKVKDGDFFVNDWLRNRDTLEYIVIWRNVFIFNYRYKNLLEIISLYSYMILFKYYHQKQR